MVFFDFVYWPILCSITYLSKRWPSDKVKENTIVRLTKSTDIDPEINQGGWLRFQLGWVFHIHIHTPPLYYEHCITLEFIKLGFDHVGLAHISS